MSTLMIHNRGSGSSVHRVLLAVALGTTALATVRPIRAESMDETRKDPAHDPSSEDVADEERPATHRPSKWYGLPMVILDAVSLGILGVGAAIKDDKVRIIGLVGLGVDGMLVHVQEYYPPDRWGIGLGKGLLSVAARSGLGGLACFAGSGCEDGTDATYVGFTLGLVAGAVFDAAVLARRTRGGSGRFAAVHFLPMMTPGSAGAGLAGSF